LLQGTRGLSKFGSQSNDFTVFTVFPHDIKINLPVAQSAFPAIPRSESTVSLSKSRNNLEIHKKPTNIFSEM